MQKAAGKPDDCPVMSIVQLNDSVLSTFPGERELKDQRSRKLWNLLINHAMEVNNRWERDMVVGWYCSDNVLWADHVEAVGSANHAKALAAMDLRLG